jgi:predicted nucleotidyltransferase
LRGKRSTSIRERVAREAAVLLYSQQEKEYKQAKRRAAETFGIRVLPSNREVAEELDKVADETEGEARRERLVQMRREALLVMVILGDLHPRLVGSVWRGTAHKNSDIDVEAFASDPKIVLERFRQNGLNIRRAEWQSVTKGDGTETAYHIYLLLQSGNEVEVVVRSPEKMNETDKCEIYGDTIKGLNMHQLRRVLMENPTQKFVPD